MARPISTEIFLMAILPTMFGLIGCAPKARYAAGEALLRGEAPPAASAPDSLRASLELTAFQGARKLTVSAALSAKPLSRYKLEVYGLPGMLEASFLWTDTGWTLVVYGREGYLEGYGDTVDLPGLGIRGAPVHDLFACLWGDFFPGDAGGPGAGNRDAAGLRAAGDSGAGAGHSGAADGSAAAAPGRPTLYPADARPEGPGVLRYGGQGHAWRARLDGKTGLVREVVREDSAYRVAYEGWRLVKERPVPRRVRIEAGGKPLLEIAVGEVEDNPAWKRNPFQARIPKGFTRLKTPPKR